MRCCPRIHRKERVLTNCGDSGDDLTKLQLVENGGLSGGVESQHQQAHLLGSEDLAHHSRDLSTHLGYLSV